ncbi:MAG: acyltransferase family protein [Endozoicomonas sp.]
MSGKEYRRDIDGLRAIAILPVVFYHAEFSWFSGGFIGVDVFFVLSGYLITSIIIREMDGSKFSFTDFWVRRARRILPATFVVMVSALAAGWFLMTPDEYVKLAQLAREQALFRSNFFYWQDAGYFDSPVRFKPLLHTWSLAVEEQFYFLFPVLLVLVHKFLPRFRLLIFAVITLASLLASILLINSEPSATFYLLHTRAWEMLVGSLLAMIVFRRQKSLIQMPVVVYELVSALGFVIIAFCVITYDSSISFPGATALPPVLATVSIVWANGQHNTTVARLLSVRPLVWFGLISFSLYLWHWPLIVFARYIIADELAQTDMFLLIALSVVVSWLSWKFIEAPFRQRRLLNSDKKILCAALVSLLVLLLSEQTIRLKEGFPSRLPERAKNFFLAAYWNDDQIRCYGISPDDVKKGKICRLGTTGVTDTPELFFWGDSHASALYPAVRNMAQKSKARVLHAARLTCPPITGNVRPEDQGCAKFNDNMLMLLNSSGIKYVLLAARWSSYIHGDPHDKLIRLLRWDKGSVRSTDVAKEVFRTNLAEMINVLRKNSINVFIIRQVPLQKAENIPQILTRRAMGNLDTDIFSVTLEEHLQRQAFVNSVFDELAGDGVTILDPTPYLCDDDSCPAQKGTVALYKDDDHLSVQGALMIQAVLEPLFRGIRGSR